MVFLKSHGVTIGLVEVKDRAMQIAVSNHGGVMDGLGRVWTVTVGGGNG